MNKTRNAMLLAVIAALLIVSTVLALFTNGNFEDGTFNGWTQEIFLNFGLTTGVGKPPYTGADINRTAGGSNQSAMMGPFAARSQVDAYSPVLYPAAGSYTARVNGPTNGRISNTIKQTTVVTAGDVDSSDGLVHLRFIYAAVMQDPGHASNEQPWFYVSVKNDTKATVLYDKFSYVGDANPWSSVGAAAGWVYLDWITVDVSGAGLIDVGDTLTLEAIAADCSLGGHAGYVYIDEIGSKLPAPSISASGPATAYRGDTITYTFNYATVNAATNVVATANIPANTTFVSVTGTGCSQAGGVVTCNLGDLLAGGSGSFTVNVSINAGATDPVTLDTYDIVANSTNSSSGPDVLTNLLVPPNTPPTITEGTDVTVTMSEDSAPVPWDLTLHATDPEGDPLTWSKQTKPTYGTAGVNATSGVVSYTPYNNYYGNDTFIVQVSDGTAATAITVHVIVTPVADPQLGANSYWLIYNGWRNKDGAGYLDNNYITSQAGTLTMAIPASAVSATLVFSRGPDQGMVQVLVDGAVVKNVDLYNPTLIANTNVNVPIPGGSKKLNIIATGAKNPASTGTWVRLDSHRFNAGTLINADLKLALWANFFRAGGLNYRATSWPGNAILEFKGQKVGWYTYRGPNAGMVEIYIDGVYSQTIDLYNPVALWDEVYKFGPFPYARHTIEFRVLAAKNPLSSGTLVIMDKIDKE